MQDSIRGVNLSPSSCGPVDRRRDELPRGSIKPFRTTGLPAWQLRIIKKYPALYLADEDVGQKDYCHLALEFQLGKQWPPVLMKVSRIGALMVSDLRPTGVQPDASIAIVRAQEKAVRLRITANDNIRAPFQIIWQSFLAQFENGGSACQKSEEPEDALSLRDLEKSPST